MSPEAVRRCAGAYFAGFHRSLPVLHRSTFAISTTAKELLVVVVAIGNTSLQASNEHHIEISSGELWETGMQTLEETVRSQGADMPPLLTISFSQLELNPQSIRQTWVIQSCILHIAYGIYIAKSNSFRRTRNLLTQVVDVRNHSLF